MKRLLAAALVCLGARLDAQRVRVELHGESETVQLSGLLVSAVNEHDSTVAQGLSNTQGVRILSVPKAGTYRIVVRRIGFLPVRSDPIALTSGDAAPTPVSLTLPAEKVLLPTISVTAMRKECSGDDENALAAAAVWDQIRTALQSAEASRKDSLVRTHVIAFERQLSAGNAVLSTSTKDLGVSGAQPFSTPSPAVLSQIGYIVFDSTHTATYYGPDANVLLSHEFEQNHCFGLVAGTGDDAGMLGLAFHPVRDRGISDIEGTLWLDKSSLALKRVSFQYVDVQFPASARRVGGEIEFQRVGSGGWYPSYWTLRMPRFRQPPTSNYEFNHNLELAGYIEVGATATESKQVDMRAFMATTVPTLTPQAYATVDPTASKDSVKRTAAVAAVPVGVPAECKSKTPGAVAGIVRDQAGAPVPFVNISLESRAETPAISERNGCFVLRAFGSGPVTVVSRRIGYREGRDAVTLRGDSTALLEIQLSPVATTLNGVTVTAARDNALEQSGFYDRLIERRKGIGDGWFVTPEEIQTKNFTKITSFVAGFPSIRLAGALTKVPMGEGGNCIMAVYVDGTRVYYPGEAQLGTMNGLTIDPKRGAQLNDVVRNAIGHGIDDMLTTSSIAAIEVYPRASQAPPEYQMLNGGCGLILLWTKR